MSARRPPGTRLRRSRWSTAYGIPLAVVKEILGHSDIRVTQGYSHVSTPLTQDPAKRMARLLREPSEDVPDGR